MPKENTDREFVDNQGKSRSSSLESTESSTALLANAARTLKRSKSNSEAISG